MKRRLFTIILAFCLILTAAVIPAWAAEVTDETQLPGQNQCGDALTWSYENGVLTITGEGDMYDYLEGGPWSAYQEDITEVVFEGGVTYIGAYAFKDYDNLETVDFGDAMYEIGMEAFWSCDALEEIHLPQTFKIFGESSFESCRNLTEIHSEGVFPSFRQNSMWDTYATIYFPAERPWSVELIQELEEAFHGRIEFRSSDGSDPYVPTEPTEPAQTEETEPETVPPTTEEVTQPTTAPTMPVTEPSETVETTAAETEVPETTQPPVQEEESEEDGPNGVVIGTVIVLVVMVLVALGMLVFGRGRRGGKYSRR